MSNNQNVIFNTIEHPLFNNKSKSASLLNLNDKLQNNNVNMLDDIQASNLEFETSEKHKVWCINKDISIKSYPSIYPETVRERSESIFSIIDTNHILTSRSIQDHSLSTPRIQSSTPSKLSFTNKDISPTSASSILTENMILGKNDINKKKMVQFTKGKPSSLTPKKVIMSQEDTNKIIMTNINSSVKSYSPHTLQNFKKMKNFNIFFNNSSKENLPIFKKKPLQMIDSNVLRMPTNCFKCLTRNGSDNSLINSKSPLTKSSKIIQYTYYPNYTKSSVGLGTDVINIDSERCETNRDASRNNNKKKINSNLLKLLDYRNNEKSTIQDHAIKTQESKISDDIQTHYNQHHFKTQRSLLGYIGTDPSFLMKDTLENASRVDMTFCNNEENKERMKAKIALFENKNNNKMLHMLHGNTARQVQQVFKSSTKCNFSETTPCFAFQNKVNHIIPTSNQMINMVGISEIRNGITNNSKLSENDLLVDKENTKKAFQEKKSTLEITKSSLKNKLLAKNSSIHKNNKQQLFIKLKTSEDHKAVGLKKATMYLKSVH